MEHSDGISDTGEFDTPADFKKLPKLRPRLTPAETFQRYSLRGRHAELGGEYWNANLYFSEALAMLQASGLEHEDISEAETWLEARIRWAELMRIRFEEWPGEKAEGVAEQPTAEKHRPRFLGALSILSGRPAASH